MNSIIAEIKRLKEERKAVILAHNYVGGDIQDIADFTGDSLELSLRAKESAAPVIVFCGVSFMAETAKVLAPAAKVLLPVPSAGCPMADMAEPAAIRKWRSEHPGAVIVAYVNTTAATKAEVDICCTSANAEKIISSIPAEQEVLMLPDRNLAANIAGKLNRKIHFWPGCCPIHDEVTADDAKAIRRLHPGAEMLVHLECVPEVAAVADYAMSTGGMLRYVAASPAQEFIIGTEDGIMHRLKKENPGKKFYSLESALLCPGMKKISLEDVRNSLLNMTHEVLLDPELIDRAAAPIVKMLQIS